MASYEIAAPDVEMLMAEDAVNEQLGSGPLRFGVMMPTPRNFDEAADWTITNDGELLVGRVRFHAPGAHSLGVEFSQYHLPDEGQLFIYDDDRVNVFGAYTNENQIPTGEFVIEPFPGDTVILEYCQPASLGTKPHIELRGLIYDYRDLVALESTLDSSPLGDGGCSHVHVNCSEGDPYPNQKRATVRTIFGGGLCSASLINNVNNDGTQYMYTAQHCGTGSTVVVRFNYQTPGCGGGGAPTGQTVVGATLLASDTDTDGRLMRITNNIPDSFNPYYAGWSRSSSNLTFGMSMHHPGGTPKRISIDNNGGGKLQVNVQGTVIRVWNMNFQLGHTEGGSSGGPLFDNNNRIRGTLTGGPLFDCSVSYYGRFYNFWNDVSLSPWLDPGSTGVTSIDGFDPFGNQSPPQITSINPSSGAEGGFTLVTVSGSGFVGTSTVTFDGVDALAIDVVNDSTLVLTAPAGTSGSSVDLLVQNNAGVDVETNGYTYTPNPTPDISSLAPNEGLVTGNTIVTIAGANVVGVTDVTFDGVSGTNLNIISATALSVRTPAGVSTGLVDVEAIGNGTDLIIDGFTYLTAGQFITIGTGHPGTAGAVPSLFGSGDLSPGGAGFTLTCAAIKPNTPGVMWVSLAEAAIPFKGGTLYTVPIVLQLDVASNFIGLVSFPGILDETVPPGLEFYVQMGFGDAAASAGVSLSNALKVIVGD